MVAEHLVVLDDDGDERADDLVAFFDSTKDDAGVDDPALVVCLAHDASCGALYL